jgi:DMSO/TMAO reductase YedYZ molybdopterin-dependent catalytic subunit
MALRQGNLDSPSMPRRAGTGLIATVVRPPPRRITNLTLLLALLCVFATGVGAVANGSANGRWVVIGHGIGAMMVILLIPWKGRVVRRGLRRARKSRWASLLLATLVVTALLTGLGYTTGLVRSVGGVRGMWIHVAVALIVAPLAVWHITARQTRPRRIDMSRRLLVRCGVIGAAAAGLYVATSAAVRLTGLPGVDRRFTGSYEVGSFDPDSMPRYIWLNDSTPAVDPNRWRLSVVDGDRRTELTLSDLSAFDTRVRAVLDCTSGWYSEQDWTGAPVSALLPDVGDAQSLFVHSVTGYGIRFPVAEIDRLLLATAVGGEPLRAGHGFPVRLVAPHRRGFWWVKWVDRIELQSTPPWWQPPFPVT